MRRQLLLVNVDLQGGDVGQVRDSDACQLRAGIGKIEQPVARGRELRATQAAAVLELHGEAVRLAETADRAGHKDEHLRIAQAAERPRRALDDGVCGVFLALALAPVDKVEEALAGVLSARPAAASAAGDGEQGFDILPLALHRNSARSAPCTSCVRFSVAPGGSSNWICAAPWSSVGRNPVGSRKNMIDQREADQRVDAEREPLAVE